MFALTEQNCRQFEHKHTNKSSKNRTPAPPELVFVGLLARWVAGLDTEATNREGGVPGY